MWYYKSLNIHLSWLQFPILEKVEDMSPETMLLLWSMKEKHDINSEFKVYFDALPEAFNTGSLL